MYMSSRGSRSQNTESCFCSPQTSDKWLFLLEVKAILGFAVFLALCNNVLEGVQSRTEAAEQTLGFVLGRRTKMSFTQAPQGFSVSSCLRQSWWHVYCYIFRGSVDCDMTDIYLIIQTFMWSALGDLTVQSTPTILLTAGLQVLKDICGLFQLILLCWTSVPSIMITLYSPK